MDTKQSIYLNKFIHKQKAKYFNNLIYSPKLWLLKISFNNHKMKYKLIKPELPFPSRCSCNHGLWKGFGWGNSISKRIPCKLEWRIEHKLVTISQAEFKNDYHKARSLMCSTQTPDPLRISISSPISKTRLPLSDMASSPFPYLMMRKDDKRNDGSMEFKEGSLEKKSNDDPKLPGKPKWQRGQEESKLTYSQAREGRGQGKGCS